jgi:hyperosmotically inducible periplasmic protein
MKMKTWVSLLIAGALLMTPALTWGSTGAKPLDEVVRHELNVLPYFGVFDHLTYQIDGDKVTLAGEVTQPVLKHDAEAVVQRLNGVGSVDNQIKVLPLSRFDDRIRLAELRAIYGNSVLHQYSIVPIAPIRIIVRNGNVTLEGMVRSQMDKNVAGLAANGVSGVFSVKNNLVVETL